MAEEKENNYCEIKIDGKFYLTSFKDGWHVSEKKKRVNKDTGKKEDVFEHLMHYSTVVGALDGYCRKMLRESGSKSWTKLSEANKAIWKKVDKVKKELAVK